MPEPQIVAHLAALGPPGEVHWFASTGSTNDEARAAAHRGAADGTAFVAHTQTAGRGRGGHRWHSPAGENVYASVLLRPSARPDAMSALTLAIGVALAGVVDGYLADPRALIKWPNDIYVDDNKLAGILVEATLQGDRPPVIVVGVGLNVLTETFPPELRATSLRLAGATTIDADRVAADVIAAVRATGTRFLRDGLAGDLAELRRRDYLRGKRVCVDDVSGTCTGIDDAGRLLVGDRPVASGVVTLLADR